MNQCWPGKFSLQRGVLTDLQGSGIKSSACTNRIGAKRRLKRNFGAVQSEHGPITTFLVRRERPAQHRCSRFTAPKPLAEAVFYTRIQHCRLGFSAAQHLAQLKSGLHGLMPVGRQATLAIPPNSAQKVPSLTPPHKAGHDLQHNGTSVPCTIERRGVLAR